MASASSNRSVAGNAFNDNSNVFLGDISGNVNISGSSAPSHPDSQCLRDLRSTAPRDDKRRIESTKGGLLKDAYKWVLDNGDFQRWRTGESSLLWIKGDPGKGKTMLLCGIIDELSPGTRLKGKGASTLMAYFFCQATDKRINSATAVLRCLIYQLVKQQPSLVCYVEERHRNGGDDIFQGANAWWALANIFDDMIQDPRILDACLVIDALDECIADTSHLLQLIVHTASLTNRVKWIVSSRNRPDIEKILYNTTHSLTLSLELNEDLIATAVHAFIRFKVTSLANTLSSYTLDIVQQYLSKHAHGTFLWVALVCQELIVVCSESNKRNPTQ